MSTPFKKIVSNAHCKQSLSFGPAKDKKRASMQWVLEESRIFKEVSKQVTFLNMSVALCHPSPTLTVPEIPCPEGVILCTQPIPLEVTAFVTCNIIAYSTNVPRVTGGQTVEKRLDWVQSTNWDKRSKCLGIGIWWQTTLSSTAIPIISPLVNDHTAHVAMIIPWSCQVAVTRLPQLNVIWVCFFGRDYTTCLKSEGCKPGDPSIVKQAFTLV